MENTKEKTMLHFAIVPTKNKKGLYTAICFEFGIIREGEDVFELRKQIVKSAFEHYSIAAKAKESAELLNQSLPKKYDSLFKEVKKFTEKEKLRKLWEEYLNEKLFAWNYIVPNKTQRSKAYV